MLTGPAFGARLKEVAASRGVSNTALAEAANVSLQAVTGWFTKGRISRQSLAAIADRLGMTVDELTRGAPVTHAPGTGNASFVAQRARVPVISWVAAGAWDEANDPYAPGAASRWQELDEPVNDKAFALEVRGDSMENPGGRAHFPEGCLIVIDPTRKPKSGDFVVVRNNDWDEATFKQYVVDGGVKLLKPLNAQYPTMQIKPGTVMVGVVAMKIEKQRF